MDFAETSPISDALRLLNVAQIFSLEVWRHGNHEKCILWGAFVRLGQPGPDNTLQQPAATAAFYYGNLFFLLMAVICQFE